MLKNYAVFHLYSFFACAPLLWQQIDFTFHIYCQDRREDTLLKLTHFRRHKRKTLKKMPGKSITLPFHKPEENHPPGKDSTKKIPNLIGKVTERAKSSKFKKVRFVKNTGFEFLSQIPSLNLFLFLLQPMPYVPTITNYTQLWWLPNVVMAHLKEGIEAVHLATGRTICKVNRSLACFPISNIISPYATIFPKNGKSLFFSCFGIAFSR